MSPRERLKELIEKECVLHGDFVLASGQRSKVYFDCKRATLHPEGVHLIATLVLETLDGMAAKDGGEFDAIGGPTIGADPIVGHVAALSFMRATGQLAGAAASHPRPLRAFLVRKESKEHGTRRVIENPPPHGSRVAIFEDVVTTGGSTLEAIRKATETGLEVAAVIAVVDREQGGPEALARYRYHPIFKKSDFGL